MRQSELTSTLYKSVLLLMMMAGLAQPRLAAAIELSFAPDSSFADIGQTVLLSATIGATESLRSFTVYLQYDTNLVDLSEPPVAGTLLAGHPGLDFRYLDHVPSQPNWLEIGATIFGDNLWAGPGELFRIRLIMRNCADVELAAPFGIVFRTPDGTFVTGDYNPPTIFICNRVPLPPAALTVYPSSQDTVTLRWSAVTHDTLGRLLFAAPLYRVFRQQITPILLPAINMATVSDTTFLDPHSSGRTYQYYVVAQSNP